MNLLAKHKQTHRFVEGTYGCRGEGWIEWMLMHKLLYLKQVTNKGLLYSIWKSAQCYVAAWMEGKFGGEWIRIYGWLHPFTVYMKLSQHC